MTWQSFTPPWQPWQPLPDFADLLSTHLMGPSGRRLCGATAGAFAIEETSFVAWPSSCQACLDALATGALEKETAQATHFCLFGWDVLCGAKSKGYDGPGVHAMASPWTRDLSWYLSLANPVKRCSRCTRLLAGLVSLAVQEVIG